MFPGVGGITDRVFVFGYSRNPTDEMKMKKRILEREQEIKEEEKTAREQKERATRLEKGWKLFKLCKEI